MLYETDTKAQIVHNQIINKISTLNILLMYNINGMKAEDVSIIATRKIAVIIDSCLLFMFYVLTHLVFLSF